MPVTIAYYKDKPITAQYAVEQKIKDHFKCGECKEPIFLKPCQIMASHFSHYGKHKNNNNNQGIGHCNGGGESTIHMQSKIEFCQHLYDWEIQQICSSCNETCDTISFVQGLHKDQLEYPVLNRAYIIDVAVLGKSDNVLHAAVEIYYTSATTVNKYDAIIKLTNIFIELNAEAVLTCVEKKEYILRDRYPHGTRCETCCKTYQKQKAIEEQEAIRRAEEWKRTEAIRMIEACKRIEANKTTAVIQKAEAIKRAEANKQAAAIRQAEESKRAEAKTFRRCIDCERWKKKHLMFERPSLNYDTTFWYEYICEGCQVTCKVCHTTTITISEENKYRRCMKCNQKAKQICEEYLHPSDNEMYHSETKQAIMEIKTWYPQAEVLFNKRKRLLSCFQRFLTSRLNIIACKLKCIAYFIQSFRQLHVLTITRKCTSIWNKLRNNASLILRMDRRIKRGIEFKHLLEQKKKQEQVKVAEEQRLLAIKEIRSRQLLQQRRKEEQDKVAEEQQLLDIKEQRSLKNRLQKLKDCLVGYESIPLDDKLNQMDIARAKQLGAEGNFGLYVHNRTSLLNCTQYLPASYKELLPLALEQTTASRSIQLPRHPVKKSIKLVDKQQQMMKSFLKNFH